MTAKTGSDELSDTAGGEHNRLKRLGKYRIVKRIGAGGMGTVFLAVDDSLNRTVALKVLPRDRAQNPTLVKRFKAEGQVAAHMEHPNIVRVFEAGEADGFLYMALEYVEGIDVYELVERRGVVPVKRSTDIIKQTTLALQHAFERNIVHRDIKPSNLLIKRDGTVKLADMGLARSVDDTLETNITRAGTTVGTVDYMSPEQARSSKSADIRSDIYSLGCTWYHMLTGHPPFHQGSMTNKLQSHAISTRPDPRAENDRVPEGIVAIVQRMMARKAEDRYQTPQELLDDLEAAGHMHRNMDESALAALAGEADDRPSDHNDYEPEIRISEADDLDLSKLSESADFVISEPAPGRRPLKPKDRSKSKPPAARRPPSTTVEPVTDDATGEETAPTPSRRAFPPIDEPPPSNRQAAARRTPPSEPEPEPASRKAKPQRKSSNVEPVRSRSSRRTKRGSVTKAGGDAPGLPSKDPVGPVDGSSGGGFDVESLKFIIPAVLVILALAGIGYAIINNSDSLSIMGGANPYDDDSSPDDKNVPAGGRPQAARDSAPQTPESTPQDEVSPQVVAATFPGAEDAAAPAADQQPLIPDWVDAFRHPSGAAERTLIVRRRPTGSGQAATIAEAIDMLPDAGGIIQLDGDGPFRMEGMSITDRRHIRLEAADGRRPVVQLIPGDNWTFGSSPGPPAEPLIAIRGAYVEFEGIHFVLVASPPNGGDVFNIQEGNLVFRNGSMTVEGWEDERHSTNRRPDHSLTALHVEGTIPRPGAAPVGKCLLENVVIRGSNLTSVELDGPHAQIVAGNCLLASGIAPAIVVDDHGGGAASYGDATPHRSVRLLATTIVSEKTALTFRYDADRANPVTTDIIMRNSVIARQPSRTNEQSTTMAILSGWIHEKELDSSRPIWQVDQTKFAGWANLVTLPGTIGQHKERVIASPDEWRKLWNRSLGSDTIVAEPLPAGDPESVTPESVHAELAAVMQPVKGGQLPGVRPADFTPLPTGLIEHVVAVMRRPVEPNWLGSGMKIEGEPVRFDLGLKRSLLRFLSSEAVPNGTHVIAFGSGLKEVDPIVIENKSIRLEFESQGAQPLLIQSTAGRDGAPAEEAFITVRNGTLDLVGANIKLPASRTFVYPKSAVLLDDASLSVRHSNIEGPRTDVEVALPLIRTVGEGAATQPRAVLLENSFLVSLAPLVGGPVRWDSLIARQCVLASDEDAIVASVQAVGETPPAIVMDHCTIAAGGAAVRADVGPSAAADGETLTLYARACVFAGPLDGESGMSVVVAHSPGAAQNQSLVWWGSANGFADRLAGSVVDGPGPPGNFTRDWTSAWGEGHEANPLTGKADVLFRKPLPDLRDIEPSHFTLADSATAADWGPQQEPIGANVKTVGPTAAKPAPSNSGQSPAGSTPRPGKNNPGF